MTDKKRCTRCDTVKPVSEFHANSAAADGYQHYCRPCHKASSLQSAKSHPFRHRLAAAKTRAKKKGLPFNLTEEYLKQIWTGTCPVFHTKLSLPVHGDPSQPKHICSLDRIRPELGYVIGNVEWISFEANRLKLDTDNSADLFAVAQHLQLREREIARHAEQQQQQES